jgi:hypothetical protein
VVRVILAVLLVAPTVVLFATARSSTQDRDRVSTQELLGVDYLRALQPLTAALLSAESDAVAGRPVSTATLTQAASTVDSVNVRSGDALGLKDRWTGLKAAIAALPPGGSPQAMYAAYGGAADLLLALYQRLEQTSQLANDPQTDTASLQRVAVVDLPQVSVGISRYADLVQLGAGEDITPAALATLLAQRLEVGPPGRDLVESLQEAVANTASTTLSGDLLGEQDGIRQALDAVSTSNGPTSSRITAADVSAASTLRARSADAAAALSGKVLNALSELIAQRHEAASSDLRRDELALGAAGALIILIVLLEMTGWGRRRRQFEPAVEAVVPERERVGAAR